MAGQKQMAAKMADEYVLKIPSVTFPEDSPEWVTTVFPALIKSIYETFNGMVKKMVSDFNDSFSDLQKKVEDLSKLNTTANATVTDLQSQLSDRDHIINDQSSSINKLQMSVEKSESYSRRSNLIFGGIPKDAQGSCSSIVHNIMNSKMNIADTEAVTFVRCHYLNQPTNDRKGSIIARFENFSNRMLVWSKRRSLFSTDYYPFEDYPKEISRKRSKLRPILREASKHREYAKCISVKYDKLHFNGELLSIDNLHKLPEPINPRSLSEKRTKGMICLGGILSEYHELSNYYNSKFTFKNQEFTSVEQGFQFGKATLFGDNRTASLILHSSNLYEIKQLGQQVSGFDAARWNQGRDKLMKALILAKFSQSASWKKTLCDTDTMHLAEATKGDGHYGIGVALTHPSCLQKTSWKGSNKLGEALMDARRELKKKPA